MRGFAFTLIAFVLAVPLTGCGETSGTGPVAGGVAAAGVDEPGEAKAYKEKEAERQAQRAADIASGKLGKKAKKGR